MALELVEVIEGIDPLELAGVDEAHEGVAHARAVLGLEEEAALTVEDRLLQGTLAMLLSSGAPATSRKRVSFSQCARA